jgi:hypothetical protein
MICSMILRIGDILPDLHNKPSNEGLLAFHDFENALEKGDTTKIVDAVKIHTLLC